MGVTTADADTAAGLQHEQVLGRRRKLCCSRRLVADHQRGAVECGFSAHGELNIADGCRSSGLQCLVIYQAVEQDCGSGNVHTHRFAEVHDRTGGTGQVQNQRRIVDGGDACG